MKDNEKILDIKTVQSSAIRILVEALKEILTDTNLIIDKNGIKLIAMDSSHTVLIHMKFIVRIEIHFENLNYLKS